MVSSERKVFRRTNRAIKIATKRTLAKIANARSTLKHARRVKRTIVKYAVKNARNKVNKAKVMISKFKAKASRSKSSHARRMVKTMKRVKRKATRRMKTAKKQASKLTKKRAGIRKRVVQCTSRTKCGWQSTNFGFISNKYNLPGNPVKNKTLSQCVAICKKNKRCKAFSFMKGLARSNCWLKSTTLAKHSGKKLFKKQKWFTYIVKNCCASRQRARRVVGRKRQGFGFRRSSKSVHRRARRVVGRKRQGRGFRRSSKSVHRRNSSGSCTGSVQLFQHGSFAGWRASFPKGSYPYRKFIARGAKNDDASSIKVPAGCKAILYQHGAFSGWKATFGPGSYPYRKFIAAGAKNDDASAIKVIDA